MTHDDDINELPDLSNRELLAFVIQEFADTNRELTGKIEAVASDMKDMKKELKNDIASVKSELHTLRIEVHQNHSTFIANQTALEKRVKVLEMAA
jgi:hypothetical protein